MPEIGRRCHELRIVDGERTWRIIYRIDPDAIVITEVFTKQTRRTPETVIELSTQRLGRYDAVTGSRRKR